MLYEFPRPEEPIRQGDIFKSIPWVDFDLSNLIKPLDSGEVEIAPWLDMLTENPSEAQPVVVTMTPAYAIAITQDCDAIRAPSISLCQIDLLESVLSMDLPKSVSGWISLITQRTRLNQKWFYLPPNEKVGFTQRMAVDFRRVTEVPRQNIDELRTPLRIGRLGGVSLEHFRERVGEFFRRYAYDEWYPFSREEFQQYARTHGQVQPFPWQEE